mmetsp:Transcript_16220/g.44910  ORF Transcript_16220/g.44910 Transcript_16220/m.44910 type:complete len:442 (-) Transcript_16220:334-1659(-)|eukprot:CAMPEP_0172369310 /NCGR_PEP_ID=MMETSP1060-20121228/32015_1 /TAXON_ID=37318 /ORGANISM="Pseudo-nitzschia pungens, Strain cf. cingulata" /LENGTH=441 /DNA_ID=CAMNT_0013094187 /DNA_START=68 /DNA_END=1393 /DNA_ORIENTATION=+
MESAEAPPVTLNVFDEANPMLYAASLVYATAKVLVSTRTQDVPLEIPEGNSMTPELLKKFDVEDCDFREFNGGKGLSFAEIDAIFIANNEAIHEALRNDEFIKSGKQTFNMTLYDELIAYFAKDDSHSDKVFLSTYRSIDSGFSCVYGIVKDTWNKRIIVSFRGSQGSPFQTRDWQTNVNFRLEALKTPERIADSLEGRLKERIFVHNGFYDYINNNRVRENKGKEQRLKQIMDEVESLMKDEEGYSFYVTGHSLGGALANIFAFQVAGEGPKYDFIPRPVTVITYAAPFSGTSGYRKAYEQMELNGLIRNLRIVVDKDFVPTLFPTSILDRFRTMKHCGIQLRLKEKGFEFNHSSRDNLSNKFKNFMIKHWIPGFISKNIIKYHDLKLYDARMKANYDELSKRRLDDLYIDPKIVSEKFLAAKKKTAMSRTASGKAVGVA